MNASEVMADLDLSGQESIDSAIEALYRLGEYEVEILGIHRALNRFYRLYYVSAVGLWFWRVKGGCKGWYDTPEAAAFACMVYLNNRYSPGRLS